MDSTKEYAYWAAYGVAYGLTKQFGADVSAETGIETYFALIDGLSAGRDRARKEAWDAHMQQLAGH